MAAGESAAAKLRRVLPGRLAQRLEALLEAVGFTGPPPAAAPPEADVLLALVAAARHQHPVALTYGDRRCRVSDRTVPPYGLVAHSGRWYPTAADGAAGDGEVRTFRLDRITALSVQSGSFEIAAGLDPVATVLDGIARTPWAHEVVLRIRADVAHLRRHLPAGLATSVPFPAKAGSAASAAPEEADDGAREDGAGAWWVEVRLNAERLGWSPAVLAAVDRPFVIERPVALRDLVRAPARRLDEHATADGSDHPRIRPGYGALPARCRGRWAPSAHDHGPVCVGHTGPRKVGGYRANTVRRRRSSRHSTMFSSRLGEPSPGLPTTSLLAPSVSALETASGLASLWPAR